MAGADYTATAPRVWAVGALCRAVADALDARFNPVAVRGEITGYSRASSGHCYFSIKDETGQIRCAMFRRAASGLDFLPRDGDQVEVRGRLGVYEARGDLQLIVESLQRAGQGALFEQFLRLKARLEAEGLFDPARKRALPSMPRAIGLVTSPGAAALHDVVTALQRRVPHIPVLLAPAAVQGAGAPAELVRSLEALYRLASGADGAPGGVDVILLVRGGGSIEDLWAFNDEQLARTLAASPVPVVCGVGHETDFTIADFAADLRAPTPTGAAELASAGWHAARSELGALQPRLQRALERRLEGLAQRVDRAGLRLVHPRARLRQEATRLEHQGERLRRAVERRLERAAQRCAQARLRLLAAAPRPETGHARLDTLAQRLQRATAATLAQRHIRLETLSAHLEHLAPGAVLARGYAIARDADGKVLRSASNVPAGAALNIQLADGSLDTRVVGPHED